MSVSAQPRGTLTVEVRNDDQIRYQIAWVQDLTRVEWLVQPSSVGHFEVARTQSGFLMLTQACNFIGTWEVEPGSYTIAVRDGVATLQAVMVAVPSVPLVPTEACFHQGP